MPFIDLHHHLTKLNTVCKLYAFFNVTIELAKVKVVLIPLAHLNGGELQNEETVYTDHTFSEFNLRYDSVMLDESGKPHFLFNCGEDNIFYCVSCRLNNDIKETVYFKISVKD